jgi:ATP-dependent RNA helicase UAP56/SUB2
VFVLSVLQQFEKSVAPFCIVLSHTRELAIQIFKEFKRMGKNIPDVKISVFYGGVPYSENKKELLRGIPHIIIGTPGRILDMVDRQDLSLQNVQILVVDECDNIFENLGMKISFLSLT